MSKKHYKVTGVQPVHGHAPGETFSASLDPDDEAYLKEIGAIRVVGKAPKNKRAAVEKAAEEILEDQEAAKRNPDDGAV